MHLISLAFATAAIVSASWGAFCLALRYGLLMSADSRRAMQEGALWLVAAVWCGWLAWGMW